MGLFSSLFGTSKYERGLYDLSKLYGGVAKANLPRGIQMLWSIINSPGLTQGQQAQQSVYNSDLLAGYQRALGDTLMGNQARGLSNSLLDMHTRAALARGYAGDRARYGAGLTAQSEAEKRQALQFLLQLASGSGAQAMSGYGAATDAALGGVNAFANLLGGVGSLVSGFRS